VSEFHAESPQAIASEGLAKGPYVVTRAGFVLVTLRMKGVEPTNEPPRPHIILHSVTTCFNATLCNMMYRTRDVNTGFFGKPVFGC